MAKKIKFFMFFVVLMDVIGLTILMPVSAYIVRAYSTSALAVTLLSAIYGAAQFLSAPIMGLLSDRYGRRPLLLISILGSAIGYFIFGIGGTLWVLFLSRMIDGISGGNFSIANAYIADITTNEDRAQGFALISSAFGLGFILGPAVGVLFSHFSLSAPAYAAGILSLVSFITGFFILPESLPEEKRINTKINVKDFYPFTSIIKYIRKPQLWALLLTHILFQLVFTGNNSIYQLFMVNKYNILPTSLAVLLIVSGFGNVITQIFLFGTLVKIIGEKLVVSLSLIGQSIMLIFTLLVPYFWMQYIVVMISTLFNGLMWPTLTAMISKSVPQNEQGSISGVSTALSSLMGVIGPLTMGMLYDSFGHAAPFLSGSFVFICTFLLFNIIKIPMNFSNTTE
jgi:DHA1 family tetracycline resistance protein-like MFS transporter